MLETRAPGPTTVSVSVQSGPTSAPAQIWVLPVQPGPRMQHAVGLELHPDVDPGRAGIDDRHTRAHRIDQQALGEDGAGLGQLHPVVDPEHLAVIGRGQRPHALPVTTQDADDVGEVFLALGVASLHPGQRLARASSASKAYIPELISVTARSCGEASRSSTMPRTAPSPSRRTRP